MRLVDFQVYVEATVISRDKQRLANQAFFPIFETVRLYLKERTLAAPFRKIAVMVEDCSIAQKWHGTTSVALGICEVTMAVDLRMLLDKLGDWNWMTSLALDALNYLRIATQWQSEEIVTLLKQILISKPPCIHRFEKLRRIAKDSGTVCDLWFEADLGLTEIKVRFSLPTNQTVDIVIVQRPGPLYLEEDFPVVSTIIADYDYVLLDRNRAELARVPIPTG